MTPVELSRTVLHAVRRAVAEGELCVTVPERAVVVPPGPGGCGDYATSIALQLARSAGEPPRRVAEILRARLLDERRIADVVVTGPGFLNLSLESTASADLVEEILRRGQCYGHAAGPSGNSVLLRCPAEVRAVVVADALARVLRSQGDSVRVECDGRLDPRWESVLGADATVRGGGQATAGGNGSTTGEVHATGGHPIDVGDIPATGTSTGGTDSPGADAPTDASVTTDLNDTLSADTPTAGDNTPAADTPTDAGVTSTTSPTPQAPRPLTNHPVTFPPVPLRPVPAPTDPLPLGRDAARWALLYPAGHDRPRITGDHLVQRESNPLFRVRYAHARTRAVLRNAADLGFHPEPGPVRHSDASVLVAALGDHPRVLTAAATHRTPDRLARHLVAVADATLPLLAAVLPLGEEKPSAAHRARLALAEAAGTVLAGGLSLLGIDAPEHL